jgi:hypothetical protein
MRYFVMAFCCLLVVGVLPLVLLWFLRRLRAIEQARWGAKAAETAVVASRETAAEETPPSEAG